ncbi:site-2 protease family protein [Georgenia sp. SYP-B2076]|uniref:site-2 protease family protein n=1 Tax=Georgenia sp. SYP-B2076 TaxID=2495881 RepID=UPI000F8F78A1|nr:site-2 protease family protein [Georgenia sp. SYP-B2076]
MNRPAGATRRLGARTTSGWVIGRVGGTPVILAPSWLVIAAVLVFLYFPLVRGIVPGASVGTVAATTGAFVVMLFVSVLLHELAHGLTARPLGAQPREYVVTFWGGHTSFDRELPGAWSSAAVSVAGPAANAVLAGLAWAALQAGTPSQPLQLVLWGAVISNAFVAGFNLLPGLPLDGGKVLEALVWKATGDRTRGTVVAAWGGRVVVVGVLLVVVGRPLLQGHRPDLGTVVWVALLGSFLWAGASQSLRAVRVERSARDLDLRTLAAPAVVLPTSASLADADAVLADRGPAGVVLAHDGVLVALLDPAAAAHVPPARRATTALHAVARTLAPEQVVSVMAGPAALAAMARAQGHGPVAVLLDHGTVLGVVEVARVAARLGEQGRR